MMVSRGNRKLKEKNKKEDCQSSCHTAKDLMSAFHIFDAQNKGYIESRELREALGLTGAGIPDDELRQMLQETGLLVDRKITFAEFTYLMSNSSAGEDSSSQEARHGLGSPPPPHTPLPTPTTLTAERKESSRIDKDKEDELFPSPFTLDDVLTHPKTGDLHWFTSIVNESLYQSYTSLALRQRKILA